MKERDVQKAILDWLAASHILAFRMNVGAVTREYKGKKRTIAFGVPGMADVLAFRKCRTDWFTGTDGKGDYRRDVIIPTWIECKATDGQQSLLQKSFQSQVEAEGHRYILARSLDDVIAALGGRS